MSEQKASSRFTARRERQREAWLWERVDAGLRERFRNAPAVRQALPQLAGEVRAGHVAPSVAARRLLDLAR